MSKTHLNLQKPRLSAVATLIVVSGLLVLEGSQSPVRAQSLTSPQGWPDQIQVTNHPADHYEGYYVQTARFINGLPVYELENKRESLDSLYRYNYLYCHKIKKGGKEAIWVLQPVIPYADEWLANAYGEGKYPWDAKWNPAEVSVSQVPESRKRDNEFGESIVGLPKLKYADGTTNGKKTIIGFMFKVPLDAANEWSSIDKSNCDSAEFPFAVKNIYEWRKWHPGSSLVVNTNFFKPNTKPYNKATCATIYGLAIQNGNRFPQATKKEGIYTLDAFLIHKKLNGGGATIVSGRRALYDPNSPFLGTVNTAAGGYCILENGHPIDPAGMKKLHAGDEQRARIAFGLTALYSTDLYVFMIPDITPPEHKKATPPPPWNPPLYPPWESRNELKEPIGPTEGMTMQELTSYMQEEGMQYGIMFDGGGSATVLWRTPLVGPNNKPLRYRLPPYGRYKDIDKNTGKRILRKVPYVLGFE